MVLEDDGKFKEAEQEFIKAGKPKEAVLMYAHHLSFNFHFVFDIKILFCSSEDQFIFVFFDIRYIHNKDWENAERVAEAYDDSAMVEVLVEQAKDEFLLKNYSRFESLLLRAHKPEMIISLYKVMSQLFIIQLFIKQIKNKFILFFIFI